MKIDSYYILYENSDNYFSDYNSAYFNSKKAGCSPIVYYVFTPTMERFKRVGELENACRKFFNKNYDCDYLDLINLVAYKQHKLF